MINNQQLGLTDYTDTWQAMRTFTQQRDANSADEIWCCQHYPVLTLGQAGKAEHILSGNQIPVVHTDRGGQVTYHGPGQWVIYPLLNLKRLGLGIRDYVELLEQSVVNTLTEYDIAAKARRDAPGVYVDQAKIASIGIRVSRGNSYHGVAFNIDMDLSPFQYINPCGFADLPVTQLSELAPNVDLEQTQAQWLHHLNALLT